MDVHVRGIDPDVWRALRVEAVQRGWSMGELIERMFELWQDQLASGSQPSS
jgi:hypothetical protein